MNQFLLLIFQLAVLLFSVIIHEVSHGVAAMKLGDPTAKNAGRLTLNPLKHLDPFGSIILPLLLAIPALFGQPTFILGWAKPVPFNPRNLKNPKRDSGLIAAIGPLSNILVAVIFGLLFRVISPYSDIGIFQSFTVLITVIIFLNALLAIFNLIPLSPLDGSGILYSLMPDKFSHVRAFLERYGFFLLILFIFFGFSYLIPRIVLPLSMFLAGPGFLEALAAF